MKGTKKDKGTLPGWVGVRLGMEILKETREEVKDDK